MHWKNTFIQIIASPNPEPQPQFFAILRRNEILAADAAERANVEARNAVERANAESRNSAARDSAKRIAAQNVVARPRPRTTTTTRRP